eukprot:CAMPEP_0177673308 /NCGR_PEP_ID=MMETSP0447-20121125/25864_1 /TAXON_ID=0 /ORGANISM="Stygamoeba regulata, Strain BSH-02190019" /LENGTH=45 /DNA_ID= /DNA_START= /DNA_END= /DNA_ORIENTATION=
MAGRRAGKQRSGSSNVELSKALSYLLRHGAKKRGIPIRSDGFIDM